jgi:hypothetical protein
LVNSEIISTASTEFSWQFCLSSVLSLYPPGCGFPSSSLSIQSSPLSSSIVTSQKVLGVEASIIPYKNVFESLLIWCEKTFSSLFKHLAKRIAPGMSEFDNANNPFLNINPGFIAFVLSQISSDREK